MKKIIYIISIIAISINFSACSNSEKNLGIDTIENNAYLAPYVYFTLNGEATLRRGDGSSSFSFNLETSSTNNILHTIYVTKNNIGEPQELLTVSSFPTTVVITGNMIANILNVEWNSLPLGTTFQLSGDSIDNTINYEFNSSNIHTWVISEAQNAYTFTNLNDIVIIN